MVNTYRRVKKFYKMRMLSRHLSSKRKEHSDMDVTRPIYHNRISLAKNIIAVLHYKGLWKGV